MDYITRNGKVERWKGKRGYLMDVKRCLSGFRMKHLPTSEMCTIEKIDGSRLMRLMGANEGEMGNETDLA